MTGFQLSPGVTPLLVDASIFIFTLALGLGYALREGPGIAYAVGLSAIGLGVLKFATDLPDVLDDLVALAAVVGGILVVVGIPRTTWPAEVPRFVFYALGAYAAGAGLLKARIDFYDPLDLLLAMTAFVTGLWVIVWTHGRFHPRPTPARAAGTTGR